MARWTFWFGFRSIPLRFVRGRRRPCGGCRSAVAGVLRLHSPRFDHFGLVVFRSRAAPPVWRLPLCRCGLCAIAWPSLRPLCCLPRLQRELDVATPKKVLRSGAIINRGIAFLYRHMYIYTYMYIIYMYICFHIYT